MVFGRGEGSSGTGRTGFVIVGVTAGGAVSAFAGPGPVVGGIGAEALFWHPHENRRAREKTRDNFLIVITDKKPRYES